MDYTLNVNGRLLTLDKPLVMGILNATPDSFFADSRVQTERAIAERAQQITAEGGAIIDVGACSTRPGSEPVGAAEEAERLRRALGVVRREVPDAVVSVDTYRPDIARMAVEEYGAAIINDVGAPDRMPMFRTVARLGVPYILMSRAHDIATMVKGFAADVQALRSLGQKDIVLDPGFGFGKQQEYRGDDYQDQNYDVLSRLDELQPLRLPVLVGVSRKSMIWRALRTDAAHALTGTVVLNTIALTKGASILRVHDVKEAVECVTLVRQTYPERKTP